MKNNFQYDILIIGGGASGLTSAIYAGRKNSKLKIAIAEKNNIPAKKINATGNGKCNITNLCLDGFCNEKYFSSVNQEKININDYNYNDVKDFFESLGVYIYHDNAGRFYPESNSAQTVGRALYIETQKYNIDFFDSTEIFQLTKSENFWLATSKDGKVFNSKTIIFAVGGYAAPEFGTDGKSWKMLRDLGININYADPALCPLIYKNESLKELKGLRVKANLRAYKLENSKPVLKYEEENGEIQFGNNYISGVAVMNSTCFLSNNDDMIINLDLKPEKSLEELYDILNKIANIRKNACVSDFLSGILNPVLCGYIYKYILKADINAKISSLSSEKIKLVAEFLKKWNIAIEKKSKWNNSQTTMGGVNISEAMERFNANKDGLFFCGEVCDIHGICGGFNLSWAWYSGKRAGESAVNFIGKYNDKNK